MKKFILVLIFGPTMVLAEKVEIYVPGMVCQMCVQGMKKNFKSAVANPETDIQVDLEKKTVTVDLKTKISDEEIQSRVQDAGYNAKSISRTEK